MKLWPYLRSLGFTHTQLWEECGKGALMSVDPETGSSLVFSKEMTEGDAWLKISKNRELFEKGRK